MELLNPAALDWRVTMIDTGIWRSIGERLWAVRHLLHEEEMFLANYSDGLTDVDLDDMVARFKRSGKVACFLAGVPLDLPFGGYRSLGPRSGVPQPGSVGDLDKRGILPLSSRYFRLHAGGRRARTRALPTPDPGRSADRLQVRGLLAGHGYAEGSADTGGHDRTRGDALAPTTQDNSKEVLLAG